MSALAPGESFLGLFGCLLLLDFLLEGSEEFGVLGL
jgi:hypothetical protein